MSPASPRSDPNNAKPDRVFLLLQGFASGSLDEDAFAPRFFVDQGLEVIVSQSYSKNLGAPSSTPVNPCQPLSTLVKPCTKQYRDTTGDSVHAKAASYMH